MPSQPSAQEQLARIKLANIKKRKEWYEGLKFAGIHILLLAAVTVALIGLSTWIEWQTKLESRVKVLEGRTPVVEYHFSTPYLAPSNFFYPTELMRGQLTTP